MKITPARIVATIQNSKTPEATKSFTLLMLGLVRGETVSQSTSMALLIDSNAKTIPMDKRMAAHSHGDKLNSSPARITNNAKYP